MNPLDGTAGKNVVRTRQVASQILVCMAGVLLLYMAGPRTFALDDPYISLHSARVALSGSVDPVYGSPALTGVTSPLYVALLMALVSIGFRTGVEALRMAAALGVVAQAAGLWYLSRRVGVRSFWLRSAFVAAGCGSGLVWMNATNGLETGWAMALLIWTIAACPERPFAVAAGAGLLPMLRPDLAPAALALVAVAVWNRGWRTRALTAGLAILVAAPFLLWLRVDTGHWMPQTMRVKYLFQAEVCAPFAFKVKTATQAVGIGVLTMLPLTVGLLGLSKDRVGRAGVCAMAVSLLAMAWMVPNSLWFNDFRYQFPIIAPWAAYGLAQSIVRVRRATWAAVALTGGVVFWSAFIHSVYADTREASIAERIATAAWIDDHTPPDAVLLVHDAGVISEFAHRRAVDFVGLKTPASMATHAAITFSSCTARRAEAVASIAAASGASFLVLQNDWSLVLNLQPAARAQGLALTPLRVPPVADWYGQNVYRVDRLP